jgi:hypothetical protein
VGAVASGHIAHIADAHGEVLWVGQASWWKSIMTPQVATALRLLYSLDILLPSTDPALVNVLLDFDSLTYPARLYANDAFRTQIGELDDRVVLERIDDSHLKARFYRTGDAALATVSVDLHTYQATILYNNSGFTILTDPIFPILATGANPLGNSATVLRQVVPAGVIDGVNAVFTLPSVPAPNTPLWVYKNGLFMSPNVDYTISSNIITFAAGNEPPLGSNLFATYFEAA